MGKSDYRNVEKGGSPFLDIFGRDPVFVFSGSQMHRTCRCEVREGRLAHPIIFRAGETLPQKP